MGKQLIIVRHGKSDQGSFGTSDFNRTLNARGNTNAPEMAERLKKKGIIPDLIVSSPAVRALSTAKYFATVLDYPYSSIQEDLRIYEADSSTLLQVLNGLNNNFDHIALFGHNPGLTDLLNYLTNATLSNLPTTGLAVIDFPFDDWAMVSQHTGNLLLFDYPKNPSA